MTKAELLRVVKSLPDNDTDIKICFNMRCYKDAVNYKDIMVTDSGFVKVSLVGDYIGPTLSRNIRLLFAAELPCRL